MQDLLLLCGAALASGAINSIAGGGTLLTFPALNHVLFTSGRYPRELVGAVANATSTCALFPGAVAATSAYRREMADSREWIALLIGPSLLGGLIGSLLLVAFPVAFARLVPWLILTAAILFALQPTIARWTGIGRAHAPATRQMRLAMAACQFFVSVYGGYFGAGIGILMLSGLALLGLSNIHQMNGLKSLFGACINGISVVVFIVTGKIDWHTAWPMCVAGMLGGWLGARLAQRMNKNAVRGVVVAIGFSLATFYFYKQFTGADQ